MSSLSEWLKFRKGWLKRHPPNHQGYYVCYLCQKWIPEKNITLDHKIPRSRDSSLIYKDSNIFPCCWSCNSQKGSRVLDKA